VKRRSRGAPDIAELTDFDAWCAARDIAADRMTQIEAWKSWCAARRAHAEQYGWPGGDVERKAGEYIARRDDEPFDYSQL
jgi:hypothetical protein